MTLPLVPLSPSNLEAMQTQMEAGMVQQRPLRMCPTTTSDRSAGAIASPSWGGADALPELHAAASLVALALSAWHRPRSPRAIIR